MKGKIEWDPGMDRCIVAALANQILPVLVQNNPKHLCEAGVHHEEGCLGDAWLPMGLCVHPWSPNYDLSVFGGWHRWFGGG